MTNTRGRTIWDDQATAEAHAGMHYRSPEWVAIMHKRGWDGLWPVIDKDGRLTGEVTDRFDDYVCVDDEALISWVDAEAGGWVVFGDGDGTNYAVPPAR